MNNDHENETTMNAETTTATALPTSVPTKKQVRTYGPKPIAGYGKGALITAQVRYDDQCGNGHNSFAITGTVYIPGRRDIEAGGCLHDEIAKAFPELAPFIKWHLCGSDGPMHYIANTIHLAGDRDCWGLRKGEFKQAVHGRTKLPLWGLTLVHEVCPDTCIGSAEKPAPVVLEWKPVNVGGKDSGEGKERELDAARSCAVWPDATDEQLSVEPAELRAVLLARLPALVAEFKRDVESLGFVF